MADKVTEQQVSVTRTDLPSPTLDDPKKVIMQIEYQVGALPPRFLYIDKKAWTKEKEAEMIRADIRRTLKPPSETITV